MAEPIHDEEADTSERVVRSLLLDHCPQLADRPLSRLRGSGTTNALWRLHLGTDRRDCIVRLPRTPGAEPSIVKEHRLLPLLRSTDLAVFDGAARSAFREELEIDDATWLRARGFELEHAVGGVLYYKPRGHALADVMESRWNGFSTSRRSGSP